MNQPNPYMEEKVEITISIHPLKKLVVFFEFWGILIHLGGWVGGFFYFLPWKNGWVFSYNWCFFLGAHQPPSIINHQNHQLSNLRGQGPRPTPTELRRLLPRQDRNFHFHPPGRLPPIGGGKSTGFQRKMKRI